MASFLKLTITLTGEDRTKENIAAEVADFVGQGLTFVGITEQDYGRADVLTFTMADEDISGDLSLS
jgi:hypothetical protein